MSTGVFSLVVIALGVLIAVYFHTREKNYSKRHPGEKNPISKWLYDSSFSDKNQDDGPPR